MNKHQELCCDAKQSDEYRQALICEADNTLKLDGIKDEKLREEVEYRISNSIISSFSNETLENWIGIESE